MVIFGTICSKEKSKYKRILTTNLSSLILGLEDCTFTWALPWLIGQTCPTACKIGSYTLKHTPHKPTYYPIFAQCAQVIKVGHPWLLLVIPGPWNGGEGAKEKSESKKIGTLMRNLELARCHFNERQATRWTTPMRPNIHFLWKELNTLGKLCCIFSAQSIENIYCNQMYWK